MKSHVLSAMLLVPLTGCTAARLSLVEEPTRFAVIQRKSEALPGSNKTVTVRLDDITRGQVLTTVRGSVGEEIVNTTSLKEGDVVPLQLGGARYYLKLVELNNLVIGDDFAVFEVSSARPEQHAGDSHGR